MYCEEGFACVHHAMLWGLALVGMMSGFCFGLMAGFTLAVEGAREKVDSSAPRGKP